MKVLVDTCVWSLALRRKRRGSDPVLRDLRELLCDGLVAMVGPIRQELLSGIRADSEFELLRAQLRAFPDIPIATSDYELAGEYHNTARRKGIQGTHIDFLLCAVAVNHGLSILTTDRDFLLLAKVLPIRLHTPRSHSPGA